MVLDDEARYHSGRGRGTAYGHTAAPLQLALSWPHHLRLRRTREGDAVPPAIISRDRGATGDHRWPGRKKRVYVRIMSVEKVDVRATTMRARASTSGVQISADR